MNYICAALLAFWTSSFELSPDASRVECAERNQLRDISFERIAPSEPLVVAWTPGATVLNIFDTSSEADGVAWVHRARAVAETANGLPRTTVRRYFEIVGYPDARIEHVRISSGERCRFGSRDSTE